MYSLTAQQFNNTLDVLSYTVSAMKECGYSSSEIEDYIAEAISSNNYNLINISIEELNECNKVCRKIDDIQLENNYWKEYYYCNNEDDLDSYDDCCYERPYHIWENDNAVDDIETEDELEAYEGFDCCKNHQYSWSDDSDL